MVKRITIIVALLLFAAAAVTFYVLAYTQTGIELAAAQLSRLERLGMRVEGVSGRITGPLRIDRFELDNERIYVVVEDIVIDLRLRWLALQVIDVNSLTARSARVELRDTPEDEPPPSAPPRFLPSFLRIAVARAEIGTITLTTATGQTLATEQARTQMRLRSDRLWLDNFLVVSSLFSAQGDFGLIATWPLGLEFSGSGTLRLPDQPELAVAATASGDLEDIEFDVELESPAIAQIQGRFTRPDGGWQVDGALTAAAFSLAPWVEKPPVSFADVQLEFLANLNVLRLSGELTVPEVGSAPLAIAANGRYTDNTLILTNADLRQVNGPARLHAEGRIVFTEGEPPALNIAADWNNLGWPLTGDAPMITSPEGRSSLSGPLPYQFSVSAALASENVPINHALVTGSISRESLTVDQYDIRALEGEVTGTGSLSFADRHWTVSANAIDVDPVALHEAFPGRVSLQAIGNGTGFDVAAADFDLTVTRLQGVLRSQQLNGRGHVARTGTAWLIRDATVNLGNARLTASGMFDETLDLRWAFRANALEALLPDAAGRLRLDGSARGPLTAPHVTADIDAANVQFADFAAGYVRGTVDVDPTGVEISDLELEGGDIQYGGLQAESIRVAGNGNADAHTLRLQFASRIGNGEPAITTLEMSGRYADATWTGQLSSGGLANPDGSKIVRIAEPALATVSRDHAQVEGLCFFVLDSRLCGHGGWQRAGPWLVEAAGEGIPLDILSRVFPNQPRYLGSMNVRLAATGSPDLPWEGQTSIILTEGAIVYQISDDGSEGNETVQFGSGRADVQISQEAFTATVGLAASSETFIAANVSLTRLPGVELVRLPLSGRLRARMGDANLLPLLVPEIDHAAGVLTADVVALGSVDALQLDGRIELARGELDMYQFNLALREIQLGIGLAANRLEFAGTGSAGEGSWNLGGLLSWRDGMPGGTLTLRGENLLVADLPEYRVVASPDLAFLIDGRNLNASGEVFIPSARIQPTDLSGAVQVSPDSRFVQAEQSAPEETGSFNVSSDIRFRLGDDVLLNTFGLEGRLEGSVGTTLKTGDIAIGRGELSVTNGKYEAYGQNLDIVRGRLLFDASPLDDPGLDIQAERNIQPVRVGLNVRGTLREPRIGFYSEPAMSQTQILSYLLVGKPIDDLQNRDTATVGSARDALALQGGGLLAAQLGRRLGLEEVGVESNGGNDAALVLGKFLSPRLFVSYGISLTESINTLKLRYTISDRWMFKTEAGEHQSADVEFTIERR